MALHGREDAVRTLAGALDAADAGTGAAVLLRGAPGMGKSALLAHVEAAARRHGWIVHSARADELAADTPFSLTTQLFGAAPASLPRSAAHDMGEPARLAYADGVLARLDEDRSQGQTLVIADDLQWADDESLFVLAAVARRAVTSGVVVVAAHRPVPHPGLARLVDVALDSGGHLLDIGPLADDAVSGLATERLGRSPTDIEREVLAGGRGNPWLVVELVAQLARAATTPSTGKAGGADEAEGIRAAVEARLSPLPPTAGRAVEAAAVLGRRFAIEDVAAVLGRSLGPVALDVGDAIAAGVVVDAGHGEVEFCHELVRRAIEDRLPPSERSDLHRSAARHLADLGAPPERVASHLVRGAAPGDEEAVAWIIRAAEATAATSRAGAARLLAHAESLLSDADGRRLGLAAQRARWLQEAGRAAEAESLCAELLARHDVPAPTAADLRAVRSRSLFLLGRPQDGVRVADDGALDDARHGISARRRDAELSLAQLYATDVHGAARRAAASLEAGPDDEDPIAAAIAAGVASWAALISGHVPAALELAERSLAAAGLDETGEVHRYTVHLHRALVVNAAGDPEAARAATRLGRSEAERTGNTWSLAVYDWADCVVAFLDGSWDDALALGAAGDLAAEEAGLLIGSMWHADIGALIAARRGDDAACAAHLARADQLFQRGGIQLGRDWYAWAHATAASARGDEQTACALMSMAWEMAEQVGGRSPRVFFGVDLARSALAVGDRAVAERCADGVAEMAALSGLPAYAGLAAHVRGLVQRDPGAATEAVDLLGGVRRPFEHATAAHDGAVLHARAGGEAEARRLAAIALDGYHELGAAACASRLRTALRGHGIRLASRRPTRGEATAGWGALTRSERAVVELVARGMSNADVAATLHLSRRTVESHLVRVYAKVGARSRIELAQTASEQLAPAGR